MEGEKWTLEGQKTEMLRQQQQHLAWSGQALVANSVSIMEEAVDQIRATFLFTSKELKYGLRDFISVLWQLESHREFGCRNLHCQ